MNGTSLEEDTTLVEEIENNIQCFVMYGVQCPNKAEFHGIHVPCGFVYFMCAKHAGYIMATPDEKTTFAHHGGQVGRNSEIRIEGRI
jgi:hypothetical protein